MSILEINSSPNAPSSFTFFNIFLKSDSCSKFKMTNSKLKYEMRTSTIMTEEFLLYPIILKELPIVNNFEYLILLWSRSSSKVVMSGISIMVNFLVLWQIRRLMKLASFDLTLLLNTLTYLISFLFLLFHPILLNKCSDQQRERKINIDQTIQ